MEIAIMVMAPLKQGGNCKEAKPLDSFAFLASQRRPRTW